MIRRIIGGGLTSALLFFTNAPDGAAAESERIAELIKTLGLSGYASPLPAPDFSGFTADKRKVSLSSFRGQVLLINFWATWCLECRPEMPMFEQLHRQLSGRGFAIIGINAREPAASIQQYAKELGLTFPLLLDPAGKIAADYGVVGLPTTFLIRRNGRAVALAVGPREWNGKSARSLFELLLAETGKSI
jgi:peroxiredoxin